MSALNAMLLSNNLKEILMLELKGTKLMIEFYTATLFLADEIGRSQSFCVKRKLEGVRAINIRDLPSTLKQLLTRIYHQVQEWLGNNLSPF